MSEGEIVIDEVDWVIAGARVPARITRRPGSIGQAQSAPAALLLHGLGASKEVQQKEASSLACAGLVAVSVDAPHHGARRTPLLDEIAAATGAAAHELFLRMLREAIAEVPLLVDHLRREGCGPIGVIGISMGAYAALGAAAADPRIEVVVSILGSPEWSPPHGEISAAARAWMSEAPVYRPERFPPRALLLGNAGRDVHVPPHGARAFAEALRPYYAQWPERLHYEEYPESGHFMREGDWEDLWGRAVEWLRRWLGVAS